MRSYLYALWWLFTGRRFKPLVEYNSELELTTMVLRDAFIIWKPYTFGGILYGHAIDLGYDGATGELVGIQIWDDVRLWQTGSDKP